MKKRILIVFHFLFFTLSIWSQSIDSLIKELNLLEEDSNKVIQLQKIGKTYHSLKIDSAGIYFEKAYQLAQKLAYPHLIGESLYLIANQHYSKGLYSSADSLFSLVIEIEQGLQRQEQLALTYNKKAEIQGYLGQIDLSISLLKKAETAALNSSNPQTLLSQIYMSFGGVYFQKGDLAKATEFTLKGIEAHKSQENWSAVAVGYLNLSINNMGTEEFVKAETFALQGLAYAKQIESEILKAHAYKVLTAITSELGKQEKALAYGKTALEAWKNLNNPMELGLANRFVGKVLKNKGAYSQAQGYLETSYDTFKSLKDSTQLVFSMIEMGDLYLKWNQASKGLSLFREVENLLANINNLEIIHREEILKIMEDGYQKVGNYQKAYELHHQFDILKDSIQQKEKLEQMRALETAFEVKEKEAQLNLQASELALKNASIKRQQLIVFFISIIALFLLGLAMLAWRNIQQRKRVNSELRQLDQTKSRFFANVSHELRTPLTLILAPLEGLIRKSKNNSDKEDLSLVYSNSQKLLRLVNEIIDLSKLERNKMSVTTKEVHLLTFLKRIFFAYQSVAQINKISLNFNYKLPEDIWVKLDINKVDKILNNLISNALKHSHEGDKIHLDIDKTTNSQLKIVLSDTGEGISATDLPLIFDRYYQSNNEVHQLKGGTGIGLALVKEYTRILEGEIKVASELGKGTTFQLFLPLEELKAKVSIVNNTPKAKQSIEKVDIQPAFQPQLLFKEKPRILIVEDNLEMSQFLTKTLDPYYRCTAAINGKEALQHLERNRFDLITSDVMMPLMDGFTFLKKVHERELFSHTPVIMLTARSLEEDKLRGLKMGVDDYITKPFNTNELLARIENLLKNKAERDSWQQKTSGKKQEEIPLSAEQALLQKAEALVLENLSNSNLKVTDLAVAVNYSYRQLVRIIKKLTGLSPVNFIKEIRLQKARQLLETRQFATVAEVGFEVGFSDAGYFSKVFQKRFGKKPSELMQ